MNAPTRRRRPLIAFLVFAAALIAGGAYVLNHDRLWNRGPVNTVFHATPAPDMENSVGITSEVRALIPDGSPRADVEAMLAADGFACEPSDIGGEMICRRSPFAVVCPEVWFVRYADVAQPTVGVTHASKSLRCPWA